MLLLKSSFSFILKAQPPHWQLPRGVWRVSVVVGPWREMGSGGLGVCLGSTDWVSLDGGQGPLRMPHQLCWSPHLKGA